MESRRRSRASRGRSLGGAGRSCRARGLGLFLAVALLQLIDPALQLLNAVKQICTEGSLTGQRLCCDGEASGFDDYDTGEVRVSLKRHGPKGADLVVEDDGVGMPNAVKTEGQEKALEKEGLGTKIAALLTRQFAGEISYEPARASAYLPRHPGDRPADGPRPEAGSGRRRQDLVEALASGLIQSK